MPCGHQDQVDASILCSLNRQQAKKWQELILTSFLLAKKLCFSKNTTQVTKRMKNRSYGVTWDPSPSKSWTCDGISCYQATWLIKNTGEKSAKKPSPRKPHALIIFTSISYVSSTRVWASILLYHHCCRAIVYNYKWCSTWSGLFSSCTHIMYHQNKSRVRVLVTKFRPGLPNLSTRWSQEFGAVAELHDS